MAFPLYLTIRHCLYILTWHLSVFHCFFDSISFKSSVSQFYECDADRLAERDLLLSWMWLMLQKESRKCRNYSFKMEWSHKNFQHYGRVKESRMATVHFLLQTHRNAEGRVWKKRKKSPASRRRISKWKWQWTWYFRPLSLGSGTYIAIGKWAERWTSK